MMFKKVAKLMTRDILVKAIKTFNKIPVSDIASYNNLKEQDQSAVDSVLEALSDPRDCSFANESRIESKISGETSSIETLPY